MLCTDKSIDISSVALLMLTIIIKDGNSDCVIEETMKTKIARDMSIIS